MNHPNVVLVFARTPEINRSTPEGPFAALPWEDLDSVFHACTADLLGQATAVGGADVVLHRTAEGFPDGMAGEFGDAVRMVDTPRGDLGTAVHQAVEGAFLESYHRVVVILENNPLLSSGILRKAIGQLGTEDESVVVCPSDDDRVTMLALRSAHPSLFAGRSYQAISRPGGLMSRLCEVEAQMFLMRPLYMLDTPGGLERLRTDVSRMDGDGPDFPKRTAAVFRSLEKKYRMKKVPG